MNLETSLESFLVSVEEHLTPEHGKTVAGDIVAVAENIANHVGTFLEEHLVAKESAEDHGNYETMAQYNAQQFSTIGASAIKDLVDVAGISEGMAEEAVKGLGLILAKGTKSVTSIWRSQSAKSANHSAGATVVAMEDLFPAEVVNAYAPANESFGTDIDKATPDMKVAMTIGLMRWHTSVTSRMLPVVGTPQTNVTKTREEYEVYNLDAPRNEYKNLIDLYEDPALVSNELKRIVVLDANDTAEDVVVQDGILAFNKTANILELSIDADKYGYGKINRTDLISDQIKLENVYMTLADATDSSDIMVSIPEAIGSLTRAMAGSTAKRVADIEYVTILKKGDLDTAGVASSVLAKLAADEDRVRLTIKAKPSAVLHTGEVDCMATVKVEVFSMTGATLAGTSATLSAQLGATLSGYSLDARFNEENMRKSNIAATTRRSILSYDIPAGKNYFVDNPVAKTSADRAANITALQRFIDIGRDNVTLKTIEGTLKKVATDVASYMEGGQVPGQAPGKAYAAGGIVKPYVIQETLDFAGISTFTDSERFADIKQRTLSFLQAQIAKIHANSFFREQLIGGQKPVYRLITSNEVLSNILGVPHTHDHLRGGKANHDSDGIEYTLTLPDGTNLECMTTTFKDYSTKMVLVPRITSAPKSALNFACHHDHGTVIGNYTIGAQGEEVIQRLYASPRELTIPTNVIGAIIDVKNMALATFSA